ncbi:hypothetical protein DSO57_1021132 [Entomophthora muscae]|uniref:Uncharacterized protein n=1 Tax=Entomophthora muscae TaxID=34485 RepID=A0ACC2RI89_9FUNG|nr:hypothetical protein DSO57_1021132 [Entomophthora muscae]
MDTKRRIGQLIAYVESEKERELKCLYGEEGAILPPLYSVQLRMSQPRVGLGGRM